MEDHLVKTARRHILVTLAWVGLLAGHPAWAADLWSAPTALPDGRASQTMAPGTTVVSTTGTATEGAPISPASTTVHGEVIPPGERSNPANSDIMPDFGQSLVGEHQMPIGSMSIFGDGAAPACEFCGGGNCLPPDWTVVNSAALMAVSRAATNGWGRLRCPPVRSPPAALSSPTAASKPRKTSISTSTTRSRARPWKPTALVSPSAPPGA